MKKLSELDFNEDYKRSKVTQFVLMGLTFVGFILVRTHERSFFNFDFFLELAFLIATFRFYLRAHRYRNFAFWGVSALIGVYQLKNILHFTFIEYDIIILYVTFLAMLFLLITCYVLSSPLYYPRVQWWEYDFRYRGDLKAELTFDEKTINGRLMDFRRMAASIDSFEFIELGKKLEVKVQFGEKNYQITGEIKTRREMIPGRPVRYGIAFNSQTEKEKSVYKELARVWNLNKKVNIRRKFEQYKEVNGLSKS